MKIWADRLEIKVIADDNREVTILFTELYDRIAKDETLLEIDLRNLIIKLALEKLS